MTTTFLIVIIAIALILVALIPFFLRGRGGAAEAPPVQAEDVLVTEAPPIAPPSIRERLGAARAVFAGYVGSVLSRSGIDDNTWDELEEAMIRADVGVASTTEILDDLRVRVKEEGITEPETLIEALKADLKSRLEGDRTLRLQDGATNVWLFVGVNGAGKTTTIGKVGSKLAADGHGVVMAAGDTFRAAATEQLETWAQRADAEIVTGHEGADSGAVIFDAVQRAAATSRSVVLADTAGRLHTNVNLMEELRKVRRVADREPGVVTEVLLVIDATTGQNGLAQAKQFSDATAATGIVLTKLDGSAKGGVALAIADQIGLPIKLVGLGETVADLVDFDPDAFIEGLFAA